MAKKKQSNSKNINQLRGIAEGNWNECHYIPIGWIFSLWLQALDNPRDRTKLDQIYIKPQQVVLNRKTGKYTIPDYIIERPKKEERELFVTAEIKFSRNNIENELDKAIRSQFVNRTNDSLHTVIHIGTTKLNDTILKSIFAHIGKNHVLSEECVPFKSSLEDNVVFKVGDGDEKAVLIQLELKNSREKSQSRFCWIWISHKNQSANLLSKIILGEKASDACGTTVANSLLTPAIKAINGNLLKIFTNEPQEADISDDNLRERDTNAILEYLPNIIRKKESLQALIYDPIRFLLQTYINECTDLVHLSIEAQNGFIWNRLLYNTAEQYGQSKSTIKTVFKGDRNAIPPMPLSIATKNDLGVTSTSTIEVFRNGSKPSTISIIEGGAGTGKSTLVEYYYVAWIDALRHTRFLSGKEEIPLILRLDSVSSDLIDKFDSAKKLYEVLSLNEHSMAILKISSVCLIVDGYDSIADNADSIEKFRKLADSFKVNGINLSRIIITTRPLYRAEFAIKAWQKILPRDVQDDSVETRLYMMEPPDDTIVEKYIKRWLAFFAGIESKQERGRRQLKSELTYESFSIWLRNAFDVKGEKNKTDLKKGFSAETVLKTPLLLTLVIYLYIHKKNHRDHFQSKSDLFETVVRQLFSLKYGNRDNPTTNDLDILCHIAFAQISNPKNVLGAIYLTDRPWSNDSARRRTIRDLAAYLAHNDADGFFRRLSSFSFLDYSEKRVCIDFVHSSFHEFLAARHLAISVADKVKTRSVQGRLVRLNMKSTSNPNLLSNSESILRLGRDGFGFFIGCLYGMTDRKRNLNSSDGVIPANPLSKYFGSIVEEYAFQQYIYDAGYIDSAINELILTKDFLGNSHRGEYDVNTDLLLDKLISHYYYGSKDKRLFNGSMSSLFELAERKSTSPWYKLFAYDHILNRLEPSKDGFSVPGRNQDVSTQDIKDKINVIESDYGFKIKSWKDIKVQPSQYDLCLRFAHYYGHLGNRSLGKTGDDEINSGIEYFTRAIFLRVVELRLSYGDHPLLMIKDSVSELRKNTWFNNWMNRQLRKIKVRHEGFVGPSQAFGDIAQQYCGRCQLQLNLLNRYFNSYTKRQKILRAVQSDREKTFQLWELAFKGDDLDFSGGLKYYVYTVSLEVRMEMLKDLVNGKFPGKVDKYLKLVRDKLETAEAKIGFHYEQSATIEPRVLKWYGEYKSMA